MAGRTTIESESNRWLFRSGRPDRWTDRVEDLASWVLLAAGLLVLFACTTGIGIHDRLVQEGRAEAFDRTPTSATLLESAADLAEPGGDGGRLRAVAAANLHLPDADLTALCERAIRNHDPCISCSAHFLTLTVDRR